MEKNKQESKQKGIKACLDCQRTAWTIREGFSEKVGQNLNKGKEKIMQLSGKGAF